jgi:hypothetical protein
MSALSPVPQSIEDSEFLPEGQVLQRWPFLSVSRLRAARRAKKIKWIRGKRNSAWYHPRAVLAFITEELEIECHDLDQTLSANLGGNGLLPKPAAQTFTDFGMMQELEEHAARASAHRILNSQSAGLPS